MGSQMQSVPAGTCVVIIVSDPSADAWWRLSLLKRADLRVYPAKDYAAALEILAKVPSSLLIVEERPGGGLTVFLDTVRRAFVTPSLGVVLLCDRMPPGPLVPPVVRTFPRPCSLAAFDLYLAETLAIQPRKSQRHLVKIQLTLDFDRDSLVGPAATLDMSADGMRIETVDSLALGQRYTWTFSGITELAGLKIQGTILREDTPSTQGSLHRYAVRFDRVNPRDRQTIERYLSNDL
jgi:PilZ domain